jgi:GLPGLI family protein
VTDTFAPETEAKCTTVLLIGSKYDSFLDYGALRKDSIFDAIVKVGSNFTEIFAAALPVGRIVQFKSIIIKHYLNSKQITFQNSVSNSKFNYVDLNINLNWKAEQEEKEIEGHKCLKTVCDYRGRHYTAWYANDIPISEGQYVFMRLSGLIMEIYDTKQHRLFQIEGLKKNETAVPVYLLTDNVTLLSQEQVRKIVANSYDDPARFKKPSARKYQNLNDKTVAKVKMQPYNSIELNYVMHLSTRIFSVREILMRQNQFLDRRSQTSVRRSKKN